MSHLPKNYIFWQGKRVPQQTLRQTKESILAKHMVQIQSMKSQTKTAMLAAGVKEADIEDILSGRIFQGMSQATTLDSRTLGSSVNWPKDVRAAFNFLNKADSELGTISDLIKGLENFFRHMSAEEKKILRGYYAKIVKDFKENSTGRLYSGGVKNNGSVANAIVDSILGHYNNKIFTKRDELIDSNFENLNASMIKLYALYRGLRGYNVGYATEIRHSGGVGQTGYLTDGEFFQGVVAKAKSYVGGHYKRTTEYAVAYGLLVSHEPLLNILPGLKTKVVGGKTGVVDIKYGPEIQELFDMVGSTQHTSVTSKPDVKITYGNGNVVGELNFSIKDYQGLSYHDNGMLQTAKNIKVQDGTPLLTLMVREAGFSAAEVLYVMRVAAATDRNAANTGPGANGNNLALEWERIKETILFSASLSAIAGMAQSANGQNLFMVINKQVIPIETVFKNIIKNRNSNALTLGYGTKSGASATQGLEKATYENINKQHYIDGNSGIEGPGLHLERSTNVYNAVLHKMYETKIKINLNLMDLAKQLT